MSLLGDWRSLVDRLLGRGDGATDERSIPRLSSLSRDELIDRVHSGRTREARSAEEQLRRRDGDDLARLDAALATDATGDLAPGAAGGEPSGRATTDAVVPIHPDAPLDLESSAGTWVEETGDATERVDGSDDRFFASLADLPLDRAGPAASSPTTSSGSDPLDEVVVDGSLDVDEHAWNLATAMRERGIWPDDDVVPLVEILRDSTHGPRRSALMRQLGRGAEPETLRIAHLVRSRWNEEYGHGPRRHLSWDAAVDLVAAFAGYPSVDEVLAHLADVHETYERVRWYRPSVRGGFSPFVEAVVARASGDGGRLVADDALNRAGRGWTLA